MNHVIEGCQCKGKKCTKCGFLLCVGKFTKDSRLKSKLKSQCQDCQNETGKQWRQNNREYDVIRHKVYLAENGDEIRKRQANWREKNREYERERSRRYERENIEKRKLQRQNRREKTRLRSRAHYLANAERILTRQAEQRRQNPEKYHMQARMNYRKHREEIRERRRIRYLRKHPNAPRRDRKLLDSLSLEEKQARQRIRQLQSYYKDKERYLARSRRYYAQNREQMVNRVRRWQKDNPIKHAANHAIRRTRKTQAGGSYIVQEWQELKAYYDYRCLDCKRREPDIKLTADHVVPVAKGGSSNIDNIQPLCKPCNSKKGQKIIDFRIKKT